MLSPLQEVFSGDFFMPHGHCYLWKPGLVWLQVISNALIAISYFAISTTLALLVARIRDLPFKLMYLAFGVFIVTCGVTHIFDVVTVWRPYYWFDGFVRAVTAAASVGTAVFLPPLVPKALALARGAKAAHDKGIRLETAVTDLASLYERTREVERLKTQFFANVSHELRTPLSLVLGPVEKLLSQELRDDQRRDLEVVRRNARSLLKQVNDLLDVAKLEAGRVAPALADTELAELVRGIAAQFESHARERQIALEVSAPPALRAQVDPDQMQRVVLNLLSNAFKFTPSGGRVRVSLREQAGEALLEVGDSGPGIAEEHRETVFERFQQVEGGAAQRLGGTGLGLAIVRDLVELHRGAVRASQAPEGGALLALRLPLHAPVGAQVGPAAEPLAGLHERAAQALATLPAPAQPPAAAAEAGSGKPVVLVVEDNPEMNRFVCETLAPDYRVEAAFDGAQGFERALQLKPDLVLSDMMMPGMPGEHLVAALRTRRELDGVPIVLLTAKADEALRVRLLQQGAQDYVMKPFHGGELRARLANLLSMKRARETLQRELEVRQGDLGELAQEVVRRRRELQAALDSARAARDEAEQALRVKDDFLGLVSHELRTPLTSLHLSLERLARDGASASHRPLLERMTISTRRLTELVESLLLYTRARADKLVAVRAPCDAGALAREVAAELKAEADRRGLALSATGDAAVVTDAHLLRLCITNLVSNALKFTSTGAVAIEVAAEAGGARISVTDTGPGIGAADQSRVFEPFVQLEATAFKHTPGVGLGLALVRQMARALGGRIELLSSPGKGSTFTLHLPAAEAVVRG